MNAISHKAIALLSAALVAALVTACSSTPMSPAPIVERSTHANQGSYTTSLTSSTSSTHSSYSGNAAYAAQPYTSVSNPPNYGTVVEVRSINPNTNANTNSNVGAPNNAGTLNTGSVSTGSASGGAANTGISTTLSPRANLAPAPVIDGRTHTVKKGDTLYSIALENGLGYRELADWNGIVNPSYIQIDQVLRLSSPSGNQTFAYGSTGSAGSTTTGTGSAGGQGVAQSAPVAMPGGNVATTSAQSSPTLSASAPAAAAAAPSPTISNNNNAASKPSPAASTPAGELNWQWPAKGKASAYVDGKTKGIEITGNMGDAIVAAADGKVVYAGTGLKGYGQLLIIKHSDVYLTAYAHNSKLLVREEALVKRGQKIAEMGNTESENGQIKLHFELRRSGKPTDPSKLLPMQ